MTLKQLETVISQKCRRWIDSRSCSEVGIVHDLPGNDAGHLIFCVERSIQARERRVYRCRRGHREFRNDFRNLMEGEWCEVPPLLANGPAQRKFPFWKVLEMRCGLKSKTSKTVIEITALERFSEVVSLGLTVELAAAARADHFKTRAGRRNFRRVESARGVHFHESSRHGVCQR